MSFITESLNEPELGWQPTSHKHPPRPPSSHAQYWGHRFPAAMLSFSHRSWNWNPGPYARISSVLTTQPFPQLSQDTFFKIHFCDARKHIGTLTLFLGLSILWWLCDYLWLFITIKCQGADNLRFLDGAFFQGPQWCGPYMSLAPPPLWMFCVTFKMHGHSGAVLHEAFSRNNFSLWKLYTWIILLYSRPFPVWEEERSVCN